MEISTTLGELLDAEPALQRVCQMDLNERVRYHVVRLARFVAAESKHFRERRAEIFDSLEPITREARTPAERQEHGPTVREIPAAKVHEFQTRLKDMAAGEVQIPWRPVRSSDIPAAKASELLALGPLCELIDPEATQ